MPKQNAQEARQRQNSNHELPKYPTIKTAATRQSDGFAQRFGPNTRAIRRLLAKAERLAGDGSPIGGTALTYLKFEGTALGRLADSGRIGQEELRAADEICAVFRAIAGALMIRPQAIERVDGGGTHGESAWMVDAQARYRTWADFWSARAKAKRDRTMDVVIAAVVDGVPVRQLGAAVGIRMAEASPALITGLRDYAARAGWCDAQTTNKWMAY